MIQELKIITDEYDIGKIFIEIKIIFTYTSSEFVKQRNIMAKKTATITIKLLSSADTGFFYVARKNPRKKPEKLEFRKYDPVVRKHVAFREAKIK